MSRSLKLGKPQSHSVTPDVGKTEIVNENTKTKTNELPVPEIENLQVGFAEANQLLNNVVLKKYLYQLSSLQVVPLEKELKGIENIRLFRITEMVYQDKEYSTYKFASVFSALQNLNCGVFILIDSDGSKSDFYMGVRSLDKKRTTKSLKDTLKNAFTGQFPGVKTDDLMDSDAQKILNEILSDNIASVSCIAQNKDKSFTDNEKFIQGLEKFALAMQGQKYTAVILAKSTSSQQLDEIRSSYEMIYSQLSPFANMQTNYGTSQAISISNSFSHSTSVGQSFSVNTSESKGTSRTDSESVNKPNMTGQIAKTVGLAALGLASVITAPMTGGASIAAAGIIGVGNAAFSSFGVKSTGSGSSSGTSYNQSEGTSQSKSKNETDSQSTQEGTSDSTSRGLQLTLQNKSLVDTLKKIDDQLKRIDECESIGMWECAAYFLSDVQETVEMAAGTYKSLMKGENSGIETSAINYWGRNHKKELPVLKEYITNFIHPVFNYKTDSTNVYVTPASLISSNELAIHMGLPRKSICGFPVVEHADFGKEVVSFDGARSDKRHFELGKIFSMGSITKKNVDLDCDSLTMHTFVTGSTGSGKSNTVYQLLDRLDLMHKIPFLVIEPAKGEYKNVFGNDNDVHVYGTNPKKTELIKINPFSFNEDIHILEHLDRLIEIFNVCWPMYAAMPAILKDAMEKAYISVGWDLSKSENPNGRIFPNFMDLLYKIEEVVNDSKYSSDSKGDYSGALLTRVRSLTNGLNGQIFCRNEISNKDLFDKKVIVDLSRVGSSETKSLIMGLLIMKLNEYRMSSGKINSSLSHITVLEEAHNILKRTSTEQSAEGSNLIGKSVEMLANSIAEMRTYGEGFIIADQAPGLLDMSAIRNTNTKIILRLPDKEDRELVGYAACLDEDQIKELSKLKRGVAAVYQNDWVEPVLVQVNKCSRKEELYKYNFENNTPDIKTIRTHVVRFLIYKKTKTKNFDVDFIKKWYGMLQLTNDNFNFIETSVDEYIKTNTINFEDDIIKSRISDIMDVRSTVDNYIDKYSITQMVENKLTNIIQNTIDVSSKEKYEIKVIGGIVLGDWMERHKNYSEYDEIMRKWLNLREV